MCVFTVVSLMYSSLPISAFENPRAMPRILLDALALAYPTKRFRSAWMGIAIHSMQSIFLGVVVLLLVI